MKGIDTHVRILRFQYLTLGMDILEENQNSKSTDKNQNFIQAPTF